VRQAGFAKLHDALVLPDREPDQRGGSVVVFWGGGFSFSEGRASPSDDRRLHGLPRMLYGPLSALTNARMDLATSLVSFEGLRGPGHAPRDQRAAGRQGIDHRQWHVSFEGVSFSYEPDDAAEEAAAAGWPRSSVSADRAVRPWPPLPVPGRGKLATCAPANGMRLPHLRRPPLAAGRSATSASRSGRASWQLSSARAVREDDAHLPAAAFYERPRARSASTATTCAPGPQNPGGQYRHGDSGNFSL